MSQLVCSGVLTWVVDSLSISIYIYIYIYIYIIFVKDTWLCEWFKWLRLILRCVIVSVQQNTCIISVQWHLITHDNQTKLSFAHTTDCNFFSSKIGTDNWVEFMVTD